MEYSMLIDEINDNSVTELLDIVIRYYSQTKQCIGNTYLDLVKLTSSTAGSICEALKSCIEKKGLHFKKVELFDLNTLQPCLG
jgi:hypothetical protein